jgi:hypothetical protein
VNDLPLIGINAVSDPKHLPYVVLWEGVESLARTLDEACALAHVRMNCGDKDTRCSVFVHKDKLIMLKQFYWDEEEIKVWNRK